MARLRLACLVIFILGVWLIATAPAEGSHQIWLPMAGQTPLERNLYSDGEITYCLNPRAAAYPGFAAQVREVSDGNTAIVGIRFREVPYGPGCELRHDMPEQHGCDGCAAWVFYANWPVVIEYKYQLGYVNWRSTIGHEMGHAIMTLHEQYNDVGGALQCTRRTDTEMDCGSGVYLPTPLDQERGWAVILPQPVKEAGIQDWRPATEYSYRGRLYYCGADTLRADRVAVMGQSPEGAYFWTGNFLPVTSGCTALALFSEPGWCFAFSVEASNWVESWQNGLMRNDAQGQAGCV